MLFGLDLLSTCYFACVGASIALHMRMNFGVVLLSATLPAIGGGTVREFVLGSQSVFWLKTPAYLLMVLIAIFLVVLLKRITKFPGPLCRLLDSLGTCVFIMVGVQAAIESGCNPLSVCLMGLLTGVGGGFIREMLFERRALVKNPMKIPLAATMALMCSTLVLFGADILPSILLLASLHYLHGELLGRASQSIIDPVQSTTIACSTRFTRIDIVL